MKMAEIIYDDGADLALIQSKKVAIIGYGRWPAPRFVLLGQG